MGSGGLLAFYPSIHEEFKKAIRKGVLAPGSFYTLSLPACMTSSGFDRSRPRLQRRVRNGFAPFSLTSNSVVFIRLDVSRIRGAVN
jgi:hypothetical protein